MDKIIIGEKNPDYKYDFRETCFGIYEKDDQLLLVNKHGQYSLVGGGVEHGESKEDCLIRECKEESGYTITKLTPLCTIDCFWLAGDKWPLESLVNFFIIEVDEANISKPSEADHTISFVDKKDVMALLPLPYHKKGLEIYFDKK